MTDLNEFDLLDYKISKKKMTHLTKNAHMTRDLALITSIWAYRGHTQWTI
jgi:hypothetical protein